MGVEIASLKATIGADVSGLQSGLRSSKDMLRDLMGEMGNASRGAGGLNTSLLNFSSAIAVLGGVKSMVQGLVGLLQTPLTAVSSYERMSMSIQTLVARQIMAEHTVTRTVAAGQRWVAASEEQVVVNGKTKKSVEEITREANHLATDLALANNKLNDMAAANAKAGSKTKYSAAQIQDQKDRIEDLIVAQGKQWDLTKVIPASEGRMVQMTKQVTETTITKAEGFKMAAQRTQELLAWTQKLAIQSPFEQKDVAMAFKTAMLYKFSGTEAQRLTQDLVDLGAASGLGSAELAELMLPLGQIKSVGKLLTQDLRQLMTRGVDVIGILKKMGYTLEDVGTKDISTEKFLEAFMKDSEEAFGGAAVAVSGTFAGLISSSTDLKDVVMRNFFTPIFEIAKPALSKFVTMLQNPAILGALQAIGTTIGTALGGPLGLLARGFGMAGKVLEWFKGAVESGARPVMALRFALMQVLPKDIVTRFDNIWMGLDKFVSIARGAGDPLTALKGAISVAFGEDVAKAVSGVLDPIEKIKNIVSGTLSGKVSLEMAVPDAAKTILTLVSNIVNSVLSIDTAPIGAALTTMLSTGLKTIAITAEAIKPQMVTLAGEFGKAAGQTVGDLAKGLVSWVLELTNIPAMIGSAELVPGTRKLANELKTAVSQVSSVIREAGAAFAVEFAKGFLESLGINIDPKNLPMITKIAKISGDMAWNFATPFGDKKAPGSFMQEIDTSYVIPDPAAQNAANIAALQLAANASPPVKITTTFAPGVLLPADVPVAYVPAVAPPQPLMPKITAAPVVTWMDDPTALMAGLTTTLQTTITTMTPPTISAPVKFTLEDVSATAANILAGPGANRQTVLDNWMGANNIFFNGATGKYMMYLPVIDIGFPATITPNITASRDGITTTGVDLAGGIGAGFAAGQNALTNTMTATINAAIAVTQTNFGMKSPSTVMAETIGTPLAAGIALGVTQGIPQIQTALGALTPLLADVAGTAFTGAQAIGVGIINGIIAGMTAAATAYGVNLPGAPAGGGKGKGLPDSGIDNASAGAASAGAIHVHFDVDGKEVAKATINRATGMIYDDSKRYG